MISKDRILECLPVHQADVTVRVCTRADLDHLAAWPDYPTPYEAFRFSFAQVSRTQLDALFEQRQADPARLTLVADVATRRCAGYLALVQIDWQRAVVGNMGIRVASDCCDRGIGTAMLEMVCRWAIGCGFRSLRLDVAATNPRALRCYEKAGFVRQEEFWRDDPSLSARMLEDPSYEHLRPHVRLTNQGTEVGFWWMQYGH